MHIKQTEMSTGADWQLEMCFSDFEERFFIKQCGGKRTGTDALTDTR